MVKTCQSLIGIETCMHLTCTNMPKEKVDIALSVSLISLRTEMDEPELRKCRKQSSTVAATSLPCAATRPWARTSGPRSRVDSSTASTWYVTYASTTATTSTSP